MPGAKQGEEILLTAALFAVTASIFAWRAKQQHPRPEYESRVLPIEDLGDEDEFFDVPEIPGELGGDQDEEEIKPAKKVKRKRKRRRQKQSRYSDDFKPWDLVKVGRGRGAYWELGTYEDGEGASFTVALQPNRNPSENGIKLLLFSGDKPEEQSKVGFLLMKNSKEDRTSILLGLYIDPALRKLGLSKPMVAIWLSLCLEAKLNFKTGIMNKPLLCLVLQHTFGFTPRSKGANMVGIGKSDDGSQIVLYPVQSKDGIFKDVSSIYSKRDIKRENILVSDGPPLGGGRITAVLCYFNRPNLPDITFRARVINVIKGQSELGKFEHVITSKRALRDVLLGGMVSSSQANTENGS